MLPGLLVIAAAFLVSANPFPDGGTVTPFAFPPEGAVAPFNLDEKFPPEDTDDPNNLFDSPTAIDFADPDLSELMNDFMKTQDTSLVDAVSKASKGEPKNLAVELECPVCLEHLNTKTLATLGCGHYLHEGCFRGLPSKKCPVCTQVFPQVDRNRVTNRRTLLKLFEDKNWMPPAPADSVVESDPIAKQPSTNNLSESTTDALQAAMETWLSGRLASNLRLLEIILLTGIAETKKAHGRGRWIPRAVRSGKLNSANSVERVNLLRNKLTSLLNLLGPSEVLLSLDPPGAEYDDAVLYLQLLANGAVRALRDSFARHGVQARGLTTLSKVFREFLPLFTAKFETSEAVTMYFAHVVLLTRLNEKFRRSGIDVFWGPSTKNDHNAVMEIEERNRLSFSPLFTAQGDIITRQGYIPTSFLGPL